MARPRSGAEPICRPNAAPCFYCVDVVVLLSDFGGERLEILVGEGEAASGRAGVRIGHVVSSLGLGSTNP
jgi:hypothetical protein